MLPMRHRLGLFRLKRRNVSLYLLRVYVVGAHARLPGTGSLLPKQPAVAGEVSDMDEPTTTQNPSRRDR